MGFPDSSIGKESAWNAGDPGSIPGSGRSAGEGKGYPLHILAWRIPWTEESMGWWRVRHHWVTFTFTFTKGLQYRYLSLKVYLKVILSHFMCNLRTLQKYSSFIPFWSRWYCCHVFTFNLYKFSLDFSLYPPSL